MVVRERIEEARVPGMRLGRHVRHDPASRAYAITPRAATAVSTSHQRIIPVLDQGNLGSCTGNAMTGAIGTAGIYETVKDRLLAPLDESFADTLYSAATILDDYPDQYPPTDTGSDGLSVMKAAQQHGWISGYTHALSLDALITGLQSFAGIMGTNWYDSFDTPDANGVVSLPAGAKVRGGHEYHLLNVDMERQLLEIVNSWGKGWGKAGRFLMPFAVAERLLKEDGDATFPAPITADPPTPAATVARKFATADAAYLDKWSSKGWISGFTSAGAKSAWKRGGA